MNRAEADGLPQGAKLFLHCLTRIVKVGDQLPGDVARVQEVLLDRLVLARSQEGGSTQLVWMFKAERPGETSRVEPLRRSPIAESAVLSPSGATDEERSAETVTGSRQSFPARW